MGSNLVALRHLNAAAVGGERVIERHVHLFLGLCVLTLMHPLTGCGASSRQAATQAPPPLIALLPLENHSNDIDAPMKVRKELHGAMSEQGYRLVDLDRIDGSLKDISVTLGVQARLLEGKPEVLGRLIPADIYCFGAVVEFAFKSAAALTMRKPLTALVVSRNSISSLPLSSRVVTLKRVPSAPPRVPAPNP